MTTAEAQLIDQVRQLKSAVQLMASMLGTRLDRAQLADRMGVHRNTLTKRLRTDSTLPRPGKDGKWLLSEVIEWEYRSATTSNLILSSGLAPKS